MKHFCFLIFLFLFIFGGMFSQSNLKLRASQRKFQVRKIVVKSPNGGEEWRVGNSYQVKWEEQGDVGSIKIILRAFPNGPSWVLGTIEKDKKKLKHFFQIYPKHAGYEKYKVRVVSVDNSVGDSSDNTFTIKPLFDKRFIKLKPIQILYPVKKNQVCWNLGREYKVKIKLNGEGPVNLKVKLEGPADTIELLPGILVAPRIYYQGITIPASYPEGNYYITVINNDNPEEQDRTKVIARRRCR